MIKTFADRVTLAMFRGLFVKSFDRAVQDRAHRKLRLIDAAASIGDLRVPPGNRLEKVTGDRRGRYSIRVNDQWRICFAWRDGDAYDVEFVDYHRQEGGMSIQRDDAVELGDIASGERMAPVHPGVILREEFLDPAGITAYRLAKAIHVPKNRVTGILNGDRSITSDTALRLSAFFGTTAVLWMNLQARYDLDRAARDHGAEIAASIEPYDRDARRA